MVAYRDNRSNVGTFWGLLGSLLWGNWVVATSESPLFRWR